MSVNRLPPSQFGIRVRAHPDTLIVTAQNKMRSGKDVAHSVSFSAFGAETPFIPKAPTLNSQNVKRIAVFARDEGPAVAMKNRYLWMKVPKARVAALLSELNISNMNMQFLPDPQDGIRPLIRFIERNTYESLEYWDVCIPQGTGNSVVGLEVPLKNSEIGEVHCRKRQFERTSKGAPYLRLNKQRVGDTSDERVQMTDPQIAAAEAEWQKQVEKGQEAKTIPGYMYRRFRSGPLLTIHLIEATGPKAGTDSKTKKTDRMMRAEEVGMEPMVAVSLSFPDFDPGAKGEKVVYRLNRIAIRDLFGEEDEDGDEYDAD
jgi:hypothetical protein